MAEHRTDDRRDKNTQRPFFADTKLPSQERLIQSSSWWWFNAASKARQACSHTPCSSHCRNPPIRQPAGIFGRLPPPRPGLEHSQNAYLSGHPALAAITLTIRGDRVSSQVNTTFSGCNNRIAVPLDTSMTSAFDQITVTNTVAYDKRELPPRVISVRLHTTQVRLRDESRAPSRKAKGVNSTETL